MDLSFAMLASSEAWSSGRLAACLYASRAAANVFFAAPTADWAASRSASRALRRLLAWARSDPGLAAANYASTLPCAVPRSLHASSKMEKANCALADFGVPAPPRALSEGHWLGGSAVARSSA